MQEQRCLTTSFVLRDKKMQKHACLTFWPISGTNTPKQNAGTKVPHHLIRSQGLKNCRNMSASPPDQFKGQILQNDMQEQRCLQLLSSS